MIMYGGRSTASLGLWLNAGAQARGDRSDRTMQRWTDASGKCVEMLGAGCEKQTCRRGKDAVEAPKTALSRPDQITRRKGRKAGAV